MTQLKDFWNNNVPAGWRHSLSQMPDEKKKRIKDRVSTHLLQKLNFNKIEEILDWGCGGGLFTVELLKKGNVSVVDISEKSLKETRKRCPSLSYFQFAPSENIEEYEYKGKAPDLLFSNEVIQHFPSLAYFTKIADLWTSKICPKYLALQIKIDDKTQEASQYFHGKNYLNGLRFKRKDFQHYFEERGYVLKSFEKCHSPNGNVKLGYFIFEKCQ
jgi:trans-aconitate methyltransferase